MLKNRILAILFGAAALFLFFFLSAQIPLWSSDEGRFASIAHEMLSSGNWILPSFNGIPYLDKPPFAAWFTAVCFQFLGAHSWTARLPGAIAALGCIAAVFIFMRRLFDSTAAKYSALCLLTTAGFVLTGRFAVIDIQLVCFMSLTLFFVMSAIFEQNNMHYLFAAACAGIAFLTKGLIGIALPGMTFIIFILVTKRWSEFKKVDWIACLLILAVLILPWIIAITKQEPNFFKIFFGDQQLKRFASSHFGRKRPFFFFFYILPIVAFPWILFLPAALRDTFTLKDERKQKGLFLIIWAAVIFVFFSIPKSKLPYYILPAAVPIMCLVGSFLARWKSNNCAEASGKWAVISWKILAVLCITAAFVLPATLLFAHKVLILKMISGWLPWAALALGITGAEILRQINLKQKRNAVFALAAGTFSTLVVVIVCMLKLSPLMSTLDFANLIRENISSRDIITIYASPDHFSDLVFYTDRRIAIGGNDRGTLDAQSRAPQNQKKARGWFYDPGQLIHLIQDEKSRRVFCLVDEDRMAELNAFGLKNFRIWMKSHGRILISNH